MASTDTRSGRYLSEHPRDNLRAPIIEYPLIWVNVYQKNSSIYGLCSTMNASKRPGPQCLWTRAAWETTSSYVKGPYFNIFLNFGLWTILVNMSGPSTYLHETLYLWLLHLYLDFDDTVSKMPDTQGCYQVGYKICSP